MFSLRKIFSILPPSKMIFLFPLLFFFAVTQSYALDVTLGWDANTESNLAGYKVYYKTGSSGAPYNGTGATGGASPIGVGNVTTYKITGLTDGVTYFFVVTAYDTEVPPRESGYSNEVTRTATATASGGGGGGCFIATAAFGLR